MRKPPSPVEWLDDEKTESPASVEPLLYRAFKDAKSFPWIKRIVGKNRYYHARKTIAIPKEQQRLDLLLNNMQKLRKAELNDLILLLIDPRYHDYFYGLSHFKKQAELWRIMRPEQRTKSAFFYSNEQVAKIRTDVLLFCTRNQDKKDIFFKYEKDLQDPDNRTHDYIYELTFSGKKGKFFDNPYESYDYEYLFWWLERLKFALSAELVGYDQWGEGEYEEGDLFEWSYLDYDNARPKIGTFHVSVRMVGFYKVISNKG